MLQCQRTVLLSAHLFGFPEGFARTATLAKVAREWLPVCASGWHFCSTQYQAPAAAQGGRMRVTELQRLRAAVDAVTDATAVVPARALVCDAARSVVPNPLFAGIAYPAKLESYLHAQVRAGSPAP